MRILTLFILCFSFQAAANETILFLDTNTNPLEIQTARRKAKELGKKIIIYPKNGEKFD
jgi:hypothetical protein